MPLLGFVPPGASCEPDYIPAMSVQGLGTPALVVDIAAFEHNVATMAGALPAGRCRPHVKAFKSTAVAGRLADAGHRSFCAATPRELVGMAKAGLGEDLLLANECLDVTRLGALARLDARVTVAVDSEETVVAAAAAGVREVLVDVNIGLARCGCDSTAAGVLADRARAAGLVVRGVMGYEGHLVGNADREVRRQGLVPALALLRAAHEQVGGDVVSGGGTGTYDLNDAVTEIQAGSYVLMDTAYATIGLPFRQALYLVATVVSVGMAGGRRYGVADAGLKAQGMDHGAPEVTTWDGEPMRVWFCSDEHVTFSLPSGRSLRPGDRVKVWPAHVDPTVAYHSEMVLARDEEVVDRWPVDLRHW